MKQIVCATVLVESSPQALPLGAACIASSLKQDSFIFQKASVSLEDFSLEQKEFTSLSQDAIASLIAEKIFSGREVFVLALSVYVWNRKILESLIKKARLLSPQTLFIAGGPEITANPFSFTAADFCVAGEGEIALPLLVKNLLQNKNDFSIPGVYDTKNNAEKNEDSLSITRATAPDLEKLSSPWLDGTLSPKKYGGVLWELARGCPFKCSYCYESRGEKKVRRFPLERVKKELEFFAKEKVPQVFVLDPTYNANKKEALSMLRLIKQITPETFYYFEARAEFIDKEMAEAFSKINCSLQFGLQSAHPEVLKLVNRSLDRKTFSRNINLLNQTGVVFGFDLIYGLPGDTFAGFKESIDYALSLYPNNLELFCLSVLPGTDLYERAATLGLTYQTLPPYHVTRTLTMNEGDLEKARTLSFAVNVFYTQGRAVPWFNSLLHLIHQSPSAFLSDFESFLKKQKVSFEDACAIPFEEITKLQLDFIQEKLSAKYKRYLPLVKDVLLLNAALSQALAQGKESLVSLTYHPDDLTSEYASDFVFFANNARPYKNRTKVFIGKNGVDFRLVK